jgi:hypothetical protein
MNPLSKLVGFLKRLPAFGLGDLAPTVMAIGVAAIIGAVVLLVMNGVYTSSPTIAGNAAGNAIVNATKGIGNVFAQLPLLGTVIGLVLVLAVVLYFFYRQGSREGGL